MVELQEAEKLIIAIIDTMYKLMSRQHFRLKIQFPSQDLGWPGRRSIHLPSESWWVGIVEILSNRNLNVIERLRNSSFWL